VRCESYQEEIPEGCVSCGSEPLDVRICNLVRHILMKSGTLAVWRVMIEQMDLFGGKEIVGRRVKRHASPMT